MKQHKIIGAIVALIVGALGAFSEVEAMLFPVEVPEESLMGRMDRMFPRLVFAIGGQISEALS
ncbi:MAG: hypothetical protein LBJ70_03935 [Holosporales bacterium]|jgi:hypothetical protein|nr:hypothetical protein [Holosporales bacterium]